MNGERDSITGLVFHVLGGLAGIATLLGMVTEWIHPLPGLGFLVSAAMLWWMGDVVTLLKAISHDLGNRPESRNVPAAPQKAAATSTPAKRADAPVYKLD